MSVSVMYVGLGHEESFESSFEEIPLLEMNIAELKKEKALQQTSVQENALEKKKRLRIPYQPKEAKDTSVLHFERSPESMSFEAVTRGSNPRPRPTPPKEKVVGETSEKKVTKELINKSKRFEKNQKARKAKPKEKNRLREQRIRSQQLFQSIPSPKAISHEIYYGPKFTTLIQRM